LYSLTDGWPILNFAFCAKFKVEMLKAAPKTAAQAKTGLEWATGPVVNR
jgi:hypothetical protein